MATRRVRLHRLLNHKVVDSAGRPAGRVGEVRAVVRDGQCLVEEYLLGRGGLLDRLSVPGISLAALTALGARSAHDARHVPWDQMDLTDPHRPRLRCTVEELEKMQSPDPSQ